MKCVFNLYLLVIGLYGLNAGQKFEKVKVSCKKMFYHVKGLSKCQPIRTLRRLKVHAR